MTFIFLLIASISASAIFSGSAVSMDIIKYLHSDINYYILLVITVFTVLSGAAYIFESGSPAGKVVQDKEI